jgi:hypothetical protein
MGNTAHLSPHIEQNGSPDCDSKGDGYAHQALLRSYALLSIQVLPSSIKNGPLLFHEALL